MCFRGEVVVKRVPPEKKHYANRPLMYCFLFNKSNGELGSPGRLGVRLNRCVTNANDHRFQGKSSQSPWNFLLFSLEVAFQRFPRRPQHIPPSLKGIYSVWASRTPGSIPDNITITIIIIAVMGLLFCLSDSICPISLRQDVLLYYFSPLRSDETMSGRGIC